MRDFVGVGGGIRVFVSESGTERVFVMNSVAEMVDVAGPTAVTDLLTVRFPGEVSVANLVIDTDS